MPDGKGGAEPIDPRAVTGQDVHIALFERYILLGPMNHHGRLILVAIAPGLLAGMIWALHTTLIPWLSGDCDMKLGCAGGVQFALILAAISTLLSATGVLIGLVLPGHAVRRFGLLHCLLLVAALGALVLAMLYTMGAWPLQFVAAYFVVWVLVPLAATWGVLVLWSLLRGGLSPEANGA